ncbi:MAG TPA: hypothetical protein VNC40_11455 [Gaiellaceae bacterium]|nr:hypothetical protein [Gaiellaceae bacterium]
MLQIDAEAVAALREIGTIRITAEEVDGDVELSIDEASEPAEGDQVIDHDGGRVFLDPAAADVLADQVLGVHTHGDHFHFSFEDQDAAADETA